MNTLFHKNQVLLSVFLLLPFILQAQIIYVKQGSTGDGSSWALAAGNLKAVLEHASFGTSIWVAEGIYTPTNCSVCTYDERITPFSIPNGVKIYGGFQGTESSLDERDWENNPTCLSGDIDGDGTLENNSYTVVFTKNVSEETLIDGFIITGGNADFAAALGNPANSGAGFFNDGALPGGGSHPTIRNCTFTNNQAWGFAGGFYNDAAFEGNANPTIFNCRFENNTAQNAGGALYITAIFSGTANPRIENSHFENNQSTNAQGGALINKASENGVANPEFINCDFIGNTAGETGGAVYNYGNQEGICNPLFKNCLFENNASIICGAVYNDGSFNGECKPLFEDCIIQNNRSTNGDAGAIYNSAIEVGNASPHFNNCVFSGNESSSAGGAVFSNGIGGISEPTFTNCRIFNNLANTFGGAIYNQGKAGNASPTLINCLIYNNEALSSAGAMYNLGAENGNSNPIITNCTFFGNKAVIGGAIYNNASAPNGNASPLISNTIFWGNQAELGPVFRNVLGKPTIQYSIVDAEDCEGTNSSNGIGQTNCGSGMIYNQYPEFVDTLGYNFHLKEPSPAIDNGDNEFIDQTGVVVDLDKLSRIFNGVVDIGPYEFGSMASNAPVITGQPQHQEVCLGETAIFSVSAEAGVPIFYQWKKDGFAISGANSNFFSITNATTNDSGDYHCQIFNEEGDTIATNIATLVVSEEAEVTLTITASETEICTGEAVLFTAIPENGGSNPNFQWFINGNPFGANISSFTSTDLDDGDILSCVLTSNAVCISSPIANSNSILIQVSDVVDASVSITAEALEICEGEEAIFTALPVHGGNSPFFSWFVNGSLVQSGNVGFSSQNLNNGDIITCQMVSSLSCISQSTVISNAIQIAVSDVLNASLSISADLTEICEGEEVIFSAFYENGGTNPEFQWFINDNFVGDNNPSFTTNLLDDQDRVYCQLTFSEACVVNNPVLSNDIIITTHPILEPQIEITASTDTTICKGDTVNFSANFEHAGDNPVFEWTINGLQVGNNAPVFTTDELNHEDAIICTLSSSEICLAVNPVVSNVIEVSVDSCTVGNKNKFLQFVDFKIYPNPTMGTFWIEVENFEKDLEIEVLDWSGQKHYEKNIKNRRGSYLNRIDVHWLPAGVYLLSLQSEDSLFTTKLLIGN